jgi:hypothetical protein
MIVRLSIADMMWTVAPRVKQRTTSGGRPDGTAG